MSVFLTKAAGSARHTALTRVLKSLVRKAKGNIAEAVVGASGMMGAKGLKEIGDLDVHVSKRLYDQLEKLPEAAKVPAPTGGVKISFDTPHGEIEVFTGSWVIKGRDFSKRDELEVVNGVHHWSLAKVKDWKQRMRRPKDIRDLELLKTATCMVWTPAKVHKLCDLLGVKWDDHPPFMDRCEQVIGKRKLDDMTSDELRKVVVDLVGKKTAGPEKVAMKKDEKLRPKGLKKGVELYDHQNAAVNKLLKSDGNMLFSHSVGAGKTLTAIAAHEALRDAGKSKKALVVAPASLRTNFAEDGVHKFTDRNVVILGNKQEVATGHAADPANPPDADYHVMSYSMFRKDPVGAIKRTGADTVILDEVHRIRNPGATFKAVREARGHHANFIGLTGSILSNSPSDIVPLVDAMTSGSHDLGGRTTFEKRMFKRTMGGKRLRSPGRLRKALTPYVHHFDITSSPSADIPLKDQQVIKVEMSKAQDKLYQHAIGTLDPVSRMKLRMGKTDLTATESQHIFARIMRGRQASNAIHTMDKSKSLEDSAEYTPKIKKILDDVEEHLQETKDGQVVVGSQLIRGGVDVLSAGLEERGIQHGVFVGKGQPGVTEQTRQKAISDYKKGKSRVLVLSGAGGEGLSLGNTTMVAIADGHFNPERVKQMAARGVRVGGQKHRKKEDRRVLLRKYVSIVPRSLAGTVRNVVDNVNPVSILRRAVTPGVPLFYNPAMRETSTDEWIHGVAKRKDRLNKQLRDELDKLAWDLSDDQDKEASMTDPQSFAAKYPRAATGLLGAGVGALGGAGIALANDPDLENLGRNLAIGAGVGGVAGGLGGAVLRGRTEAQRKAFIDAVPHAEGVDSKFHDLMRSARTEVEHEQAAKKMQNALINRRADADLAATGAETWTGQPHMLQKILKRNQDIMPPKVASAIPAKWNPRLAAEGAARMEAGAAPHVNKGIRGLIARFPVATSTLAGGGIGALAGAGIGALPPDPEWERQNPDSTQKDRMIQTAIAGGIAGGGLGFLHRHGLERRRKTVTDLYGGLQGKADFSDPFFRDAVKDYAGTAAARETKRKANSGIAGRLAGPVEYSDAELINRGLRGRPSINVGGGHDAATGRMVSEIEKGMVAPKSGLAQKLKDMGYSDLDIRRMGHPDVLDHVDIPDDAKDRLIDAGIQASRTVPNTPAAQAGAQAQASRQAFLEQMEKEKGTVFGGGGVNKLINRIHKENRGY